MSLNFRIQKLGYFVFASRGVPCTTTEWYRVMSYRDVCLGIRQSPCECQLICDWWQTKYSGAYKRPSD